jgi:hypothetical protein
MSVVERIVAGIGLVLLGTTFLRLARTDTTDRLYLVVLEYGFALALVVAGVGLIALSAALDAL